MGNGNKKDESVTRVTGTLDIHYRVTVIIITYMYRSGTCTVPYCTLKLKKDDLFTITMVQC